jgi:hypothetical protein
MRKTDIVIAIALFFLCLGLSMAQSQTTKTANEPLVSTYEGIGARAEILSEVKFENNLYVLSWTFSNKGREKIRLFPKNMNMLICLLPLEDNDFSINLKPGETKSVTMNTTSQPIVMETADGLAFYKTDIGSWSESAFISFQIYALSLEKIEITERP